MKFLALFVILIRLNTGHVINRRQVFTFNGQNLEAFKQDSYLPPAIAQVNDGQPPVTYGPPPPPSPAKPTEAYGAPPPSNNHPPSGSYGAPPAPHPPPPPPAELPVAFVPPPPPDPANPTGSYGPPLNDEGQSDPTPAPTGGPGGYSDGGGGTSKQYGPPATNSCGHCGGYGGGGKVTFSQLIQSYADVVNAKINKIFGLIQHKIQLFGRVLEGVHQAVHVPGTQH